MDVLRALGLDAAGGLKESDFEKDLSDSNHQNNEAELESFSSLLSQTQGKEPQLEVVEANHWTDKEMIFNKGMLETHPTSERALGRGVPIPASDLASAFFNGSISSKSGNNEMVSGGSVGADSSTSAVNLDEFKLLSAENKKTLNEFFANNETLSPDEQRVLAKQLNQIVAQKLKIAQSMADVSEAVHQAAGKEAETSVHKEILDKALYELHRQENAKNLEAPADKNFAKLSNIMSADEFVNLKNNLQKKPVLNNSIENLLNEQGIRDQASSRVVHRISDLQEAPANPVEELLKMGTNNLESEVNESPLLNEISLKNQQKQHNVLDFNSAASLGQIKASPLSMGVSSADNINSFVDLNAPSGNLTEPLFKQVSFKALQGGGEFNITLNPEHLGELKVKVRSSGSSIDVSVQTQNNDVAQLIKNDLSKLGTRLEANNLQLNNFDISVSSNKESQMSFQDGNGGSFYEQAESYAEQQERWNDEGQFHRQSSKQVSELSRNMIHNRRSGNGQIDLRV